MIYLQACILLIDAISLVTAFWWIGRVERNSEGRFYDADTIRFWVRWETGTGASGELPEPGWYPAADIYRVI